MFARIPMLVLVVAALIAFPSTVGAARQHDDIVITPSPVKASSSYHVAVCGVRAKTLTYVDTTGLNFFNRSAYMSDGQGCVAYDATSGSLTGQYGITVQQLRGSNLVVLGWAVFNVT